MQSLLMHRTIVHRWHFQGKNKVVCSFSIHCVVCDSDHWWLGGSDADGTVPNLNSLAKMIL